MQPLVRDLYTISMIQYMVCDHVPAPFTARLNCGSVDDDASHLLSDQTVRSCRCHSRHTAQYIIMAQVLIRSIVMPYVSHAMVYPYSYCLQHQGMFAKDSGP